MRRYLLLLIRLIVGVFIIIGAAQTIANNNPVIAACGTINTTTFQCVINDVPLSLTDAPACMSDVSICCTDANECPEPPPPSCKNRGDICTPESEICEINDFFCDCALLPCLVAQRTCLAGGGCCREVQDDRVVFTCDSGEPTEQTEQCRCIFEEHPSRIHSSLCDIAGLIGIDTAIGCIPFVDITKTTAFLINWGIGIGGGVALIVIVIAGFIIMSSAGDPKRLNLGKELLFAAISGLILLVFSVFVLRILGIKILGLF